MWNHHHRQAHDVPGEDYLTSLEQWVCTCPHFYRSRFLLCKHLVRLSPHGFISPFEFYTKRNLQSPFITMQSISDVSDKKKFYCDNIYILNVL
ncbi:hypothetical protein BC941DRAFT_406415 [Chlamydoabsidia padenii]|nr:hypothetical protein BC941DRAFT_406415 [Chlamydoabsidia padenii]